MTDITTSIVGADSNRAESKAIRLPWKLSATTVALGLIILAAAALRFTNLAALGDGNLYYTAAVKSMLQSFSNFFFAAAEPGGSVTVDKPPVGLWLQAISALIFGVNGFAVILPQLLAGVFSVPLLYYLVKRYFGAAAGLIAALALAVLPVAIATDRNNTMDSTLIFTLLLAAWAFIKATDTGKLKWLLLGGVLIGVGFNIKMLQAVLPLPAFFALYFLGTHVGWRRKFVNLALTTVVLVVVSLSWAVAVDLIPASQRPYIGSSTDNTVMELIVGHNGLNRLTGENGPGGMPGNMQGNPPNGSLTPPAGQDGAPSTGQTGNFTPPSGTFQPGQRPDDGPGGGGGAFGNEIGQPGVLRLFTQPLANEISWLLPFGLFSVVLVTLSSRLRLPVSTEHKGVPLWGGWLLTEVVFFSIAGFYHAYYLAMLAPPLAALIGMGVIRLWNLREQHKKLASLLLVAAAGSTVLFQVWVANRYAALPWWVVPAVVLVVCGAVALLTRIATSKRAVMIGFTLVVCGMLLIPAGWSWLTVSAASQEGLLPHAFNGQSNRGPDGNSPMIGGNGPSDTADLSLVSYLQAHTQDTRYLLAVQTANQGAPYVMATGRPVLYIGGFLGTDKVVDVEGLQTLVKTGQLRYVLSGGMGGGPGGDSSDISTWLQSSCKVVTDVSTRGGTLYQCS